MIQKKSWKWIRAYEEARKKYSVEKSKEIANRTKTKRKRARTTISRFPSVPKF